MRPFARPPPAQSQSSALARAVPTEPKAPGGSPRTWCPRGWTVTSGGALGIDAAAHRGALDARGSTIAILPCGIDNFHPHQHRALFAEIEQSGLLVSEYPPQVNSIRDRLLDRNRLTAALTTAVAVVEAGIRSGTGNTVRTARKLHRPVFALASDQDLPTTRGCREWIDNGVATPISAAHDILKSLPSESTSPSAIADPAALPTT
ncbi:DNA-processing protein DprA [Nocardia sp. NPDC052278]|uniref:DNA-processing protein DprA n=1 Tax=unclassified Nocardia TaxID=2637762 RepID=UPI0036B4F4BD